MRSNSSSALALGLLVLILAVPVQHQSHSDDHSSATVPTAKEIIERYIAARGGRAAIAALNSRIVEGSFDLPGAHMIGRIRTFEKAPDSYLNVIQFPDGSVFKEGFDGKTLWESDSNGAHAITGPALRDAGREADFYRDIKLMELYQTIVLKGTQRLDDREAYCVEATPQNGSAEQMCFDVETGLLIGRSYTRGGIASGQEFIIRYDDYRPVNGIQIPFTRRRLKPSAWTLKVTNVQSNAPIDDAIFRKP